MANRSAIRLHRDSNSRPRIIGKTVIHREGGLGLLRAADNAGRDAGHGAMRRNVVEHDTSRTDFGSLPDFDISENLRPGADQDTFANFRVTVTCLLARPAERDFVQHGNVVLNDGRLADHDSRAMIDENAVADAGCRMNVDGKDLRDAVLQEQRQRADMAPDLAAGQSYRQHRRRFAGRWRTADNCCKHPRPAMQSCWASIRKFASSSA